MFVCFVIVIIVIIVIKSNTFNTIFTYINFGTVQICFAFGLQTYRKVFAFSVCGWFAVVSVDNSKVFHIINNQCFAKCL